MGWHDDYPWLNTEGSPRYPNLPNWPGENHLARLAVERFAAARGRGPNWDELVATLTALADDDEPVARAMAINAINAGAVVQYSGSSSYTLGDYVPAWATISREDGLRSAAKPWSRATGRVPERHHFGHGPRRSATEYRATLK